MKLKDILNEGKTETKVTKINEDQYRKLERELKALAGVVKIDFSEALEMLQEDGVLEAIDHLEIAIERIQDVVKDLKRKNNMKLRDILNESVNEARTVSKPIKVDNDTMVQIVGDNKGFRELTVTLNPKTGKPIQKFGYERGNEIADSKEELIKKLQKKYGKSIKVESVNEAVSKTYKIPTQRGTLHIEVEEDTAGVMVDVIFNRVDLSTTDIQFPTDDVEITKRKKKVKLKESVNEESVNEGASTEEKRIVMMAIKKITKYRNVPLNYAVGDVIRAAEELERDIQKGKVK